MGIDARSVASTGARGQNSQGLQGADGFPDCSPADAQGGGEFSFRGEARTIDPGPGEDLVIDVMHDDRESAGSRISVSA